ncbi:MAG: CarD family transcriptional regulator, partial [Pygmaiobacter sp.]
LIIYGSSGVCRVLSVGAPKAAMMDQSKVYYTLCPLYSTETIYTPVDTGVFMRPIVSRAEAEALIAQIPSIQEDVCEDRNPSFLKEHYKGVLQTHDCEDLIQLIKSIYSKSEDVTLRGKKLGQVDQQYWKRAEELLYGELSAALDIPYAEMGTFLSSAIMIAKPKEDAPDAAAPAVTLTKDDTAQTAEIAPLPLSTAL